METNNVPGGQTPWHKTPWHKTPCHMIYVHIPFCVRKCRYCDFLSQPADEIVRKSYLEALICEIMCQRVCPPGTPVDSVFFGGGTPSVLAGDEVSLIMDALRERFRILPDAEISLEMNPGTADAGKLRVLKEAGINRLSIGVQSMNDEELRLLGRIHTRKQAQEAYLQARKAGFENINLDLMCALPGQAFESWADTLEQAVDWQPEHISAYSLIIEPGTPFARMYEAGELPELPDEETERRMVHYTRNFLDGHGYRQYEISNFAKPGLACRHNMGYWTGRPYLGFGIGAASYVDGMRFSNSRDIGGYIRAMENQDLSAVRTDLHHLSEEEKMEEFMFLGLRMSAGVRRDRFAARFGRPLEDVYGDVIRRHIAQGVLERTEEEVRLTKRGVDVSNYVLADYLL